MTRFIREEELTIENGQLVRIVTGRVGTFAMEVAKIYEDGRVYLRNIECRPIAGWVMDVPGRTYHELFYGTPYTAKLTCFICPRPKPRITISMPRWQNQAPQIPALFFTP